MLVKLKKMERFLDMKKTWLMISSSAPQILHLKSHLIPRALRFFETGRILYTTCQTKCHNFGEHCNFHEKANKSLVS